MKQKKTSAKKPVTKKPVMKKAAREEVMRQMIREDIAELQHLAKSLRKKVH